MKKTSKPAMDKQEMTKLILLLRFGTTTPTKELKVLLPLRLVASTVHLSIEKVRSVCVLAVAETKDMAVRETYERRKVPLKQQRFLTSPTTLKEWCSKSLGERAVLLHRRYPETHISASYISKLYSKHGITKKAIVKKKNLRPSQLAIKD